MSVSSRRPTFSTHFFFFNATATTVIYTLSLHDALPISFRSCRRPVLNFRTSSPKLLLLIRDRKSTRLNSSHEWISYAVFCLKKKKRNPRKPDHLESLSGGASGISFLFYIHY